MNIETWLNIVQDWILPLLVFLLLLLLLVRSNKDNAIAARFDNGLAHLAKSLLTLIQDYLLKTIRLAFNILHFPVGVEFRDFKFSYYNYKYEKGGILKQEKIDPNYAYIEYKSFYLLISILCFIIPLAVYANTKFSLSLFMSDPLRANALAFLIGSAVFFSDVAIIRISIRQYGVFWWKRVPAFFFRFVIVACTSVVLGMSVLPSMYQEELNDKLRSREQQKITSSPDVGKFERDRQAYLGKLYKLHQQSFCAGFAFSGGGRNEPYKGLSIVDLDGTIGSFTKTATISQNVQLTPPLEYPCLNQIAQDEPKCTAVRPIKVTPCSNAYGKSVEVLRVANSLVGSESALSNFNPAIFRSVQSANLKEVSELNSEYGRLKSSRDAIIENLNNARLLHVEMNLQLVKKNNPGNNIISRIIGSTLGFFEPFSQSVIKSPRLGVNEAAEVLFDKIKQIWNGQFGALLAISILLILAIFEFLIVILKSLGDYNSISRRNRRLDRAYQNFLLTGTVSPILKSKADMRDDWSLIEHIHEIYTAIIELLASIAPSALRLRFAILLLAAIVTLILIKVLHNPWWYPAP